MALPGQKPLNFISSIPKNKSTNVSTSLKTITLFVFGTIKTERSGT